MKFRLLVCDLDNTLYDWVAYFVPSFYAMIDEAVRILQCDREVLLDDLQRVHQKHHDSEHPFSLLEAQTVLETFAGMSRTQIASELDSAFHAFNSSRKKYLSLHVGVREALEEIRSRGMIIIAHTDSNLFGTLDRLSRLGIDEYFDRIYCRERPNSEHPDPTAAEQWLSSKPLERVHELSRHQMKPDPTVLREICSSEGIPREETVYIGDSIAKDILMAKKANVYGIWASYGSILDSGDYEKLVRITHWTDEDVERERNLRREAENIQPDFIAAESFGEILDPLFSNGRPSVA